MKTLVKEKFEKNYQNEKNYFKFDNFEGNSHIEKALETMWAEEAKEQTLNLGKYLKLKNNSKLYENIIKIPPIIVFVVMFIYPLVDLLNMLKEKEEFTIQNVLAAIFVAIIVGAIFSLSALLIICIIMSLFIIISYWKYKIFGKNNLYIEEQKRKFLSDKSFFYQEVIKYFQYEYEKNSRLLIDTERKVKIQVTEKRYDIQVKVNRSKADLERKESPLSETMKQKLTESIPLLENRLKEFTPEEQEIINARDSAQRKLASIQELISEYSIKKDSYSANKDLFDRTRELIELANPDDYISMNGSHNPILMEIRQEFEEINGRLEIVLQQKNEIQNHLLLEEGINIETTPLLTTRMETTPLKTKQLVSTKM